MGAAVGLPVLISDRSTCPGAASASSPPHLLFGYGVPRWTSGSRRKTCPRGSHVQPVPEDHLPSWRSPSGLSVGWPPGVRAQGPRPGGAALPRPGPAARGAGRRPPRSPHARGEGRPDDRAGGPGRTARDPGVPLVERGPARRRPHRAGHRLSPGDRARRDLGHRPDAPGHHRDLGRGAGHEQRLGWPAGSGTSTRASCSGRPTSTSSATRAGAGGRRPTARTRCSPPSWESPSSRGCRATTPTT